MAMKDWDKIGTHTKRFSNMYGKKGKQTVIWIDNWQKGNYAIVLGKEVGEMTYKEDKVLANVGSRAEALKYAKSYMRRH